MSTGGKRIQAVTAFQEAVAMAGKAYEEAKVQNETTFLETMIKALKVYQKAVAMAGEGK